jgi:acyl carrier protein
MGALRGWRHPGSRRPALYNAPLSERANRIVSTPYGATPNGTAPNALESELADLLVSALNLDLKASEIDPSASLFNEGLGLDSIDVLELALEVSQRYGMQLRADDENNHAIFQSLRTLAAHVAQHRTK